MDVIKLLPDNIANQIAAGEVVQRPASVVKELLENAIDAKATHIQLIIKNGGKTLIQVIDNGIGMSEMDGRMCFERHATSKIKQMDDLYQIRTLGFRGEAMASIAAVAQVELRTKKADEDVGTLIAVENSQIKEHQGCSCPTGTSVSVKNLFFNVPARKNFLKSNPVEIRHITEEFLHVALANPEIQFNFFNENEEVYHLRSGNLKQRIVAIWGKRYEEGLVPVEEDAGFIKVSGYIGKPDFSKKSRGEQYFFANNRFIRSPYLNHAVSAGYESLIPDDAFPFYMLFLELDPARMDINVHPTKTEIKFDDEKSVYQVIRSAVRHSLNRFNVTPALNFDGEAAFEIRPNATNQPDFAKGVFRSSKDLDTSGSKHFNTAIQNPKAKREDWEALYEVLKQSTEEDTNDTASIENNEEDVKKGFIQLHKKYIVTTLRSGLLIVHQSLAHERILFERYYAAMSETPMYSQRLLFPEVMEFNAADFAIIKELLPELKILGFELEEFGKSAFILNGMPVEFQNKQDINIIERVLEDFKNADIVHKDKRAENVAAALARHTAILAGQTLKEDEMSTLIDELFACSSPYFSPDGKPIMITLSTDELDKKFKKQ